jgi:transcriptional accessory protein Tex/SPT6
VQHICADAIALDPETRQHVRDAYDRGGSFNSRASAASKKAAAGAGAAAVAGSGKDDSRKRKRQGGNDKKRPTGQYANYEDFQVNLNRVKPHWVLAVDRGEAEKALTVTITLHESSEKRLKNDIVRFWLRKVHRSATDVITAAVMDGYSRLLSRRYVSSAPTTHSPMPLLPSHGHSLSIPPCCDQSPQTCVLYTLSLPNQRILTCIGVSHTQWSEYRTISVAITPAAPLPSHIFAHSHGRSHCTVQVRECRRELTRTAHTAAAKVFGRNVRALLLTRPIRGHRVCAIDPGFANGCKIAVLDETGAAVETCTLYPHPPRNQVCSYLAPLSSTPSSPSPPLALSARPKYLYGIPLSI